jgi:thiamine biosynthesis lipoprotein
MSESRPVGCAGLARIARVEAVMGMPVIVEVCDAGFDEAAVDAVYRWLHHVDQTFSTYNSASEISRLNRGEIDLADASLAVRSVIQRCTALRVQTDGFFDIRAAMPGGGVDPSGFVKGWAVLGGARLLERAGAANFCIDAGGDVIVRGEAPQGGPWRIGIAHPLTPDAILGAVALADGAIATSGSYARGHHITDPHSGRAASGLLSVTVIGQDLPLADAFATAAFAMGHAALEWCRRQRGYEFLIVTDAQEVFSTPGFDRYRLREHAA